MPAEPSGDMEHVPVPTHAPPAAPASRRQAVMRLAHPGLVPEAAGAAAPLEFQVVSWHAFDEEEPQVEDECDEDGRDAGPPRMSKAWQALRYVIHAFGVRSDGSSACVRLEGFPPFFYVKVPPDLGRGPRRAAAVRALADALSARDARLDVDDATPLRKRDFWGFSDGAEFDFVRLRFRSLRAMRVAAARIRDRSFNVRGFGSARVALYESNIDPLLRFIHVQALQPAGWMRVEARHLTALPDYSSCDAAFSCQWKRARPSAARSGLAPLLLAAFDIECSSAHGDFPVAKKDYRRLAIDLAQEWDRQALRAAGRYAAVERLERVVLDAFGLLEQPADAPRSPVARLQLKRPLPAGEAGGDAACIRRLARMHCDDLYSILRDGGASAGAKQQQQQRDAGDDDDDERAHPAPRVWWGHRPPPRDDVEGAADNAASAANASAAGEVEDTSMLGALTAALNALFEKRWPVEGDPVIQIGMTLGVYGAPSGAAVSERHVLVLGTCDDAATRDAEPQPIVVHRFDKEIDMLLAWVELVRALDPDVLLGYNIFGFDMAYLYGRAQELLGERRCESEFCHLGRLKALPSAFVEQKLSSSALGDNILYYLDMHGRVQVDLMKVVQRDHRLDSYKLDNVAEHFLGVRKHDVSPNDIFRLQRGSSADRAVIAAYCVQDCELCNLLAAKLEILANNSGMANVCIVPLSFIFMRGQGVKIFSLVAKRCRDDGLLIPTRQKPRVGAAAADGEEEEGYEGAIVLEPQVGMYLDDPVSVLDYNSLYPSSMISHNLSHDSLVIDHARYGSLPGVEYVEVCYDRYEGKGDEKRRVGECVCRYARRGNGGGGLDGAVLPRILRDLLAQRKATRKVLAALGDGPEHEFQRAVLDGLQVAYKVTANSLYGQMGACTSPLYLKHVAACTTAVGRSMIVQAKKYVEEHCGGKVVYGDSVPGYTPVIVRIRMPPSCLSACVGGLCGAPPRVMLLAVDELERHVAVRRGWHDCGGGKQALELVEGAAEALDDAGWTPLLRVIRHALAPGRKVVEVRTGRSIVHVTDEHSLLSYDGLPLQARSVRGGTRLLHAGLSTPVGPPPGELCSPRTLEEWSGAAGHGVHVRWDELDRSFGTVVHRYKSLLVGFAQRHAGAGAGAGAGDCEDVPVEMILGLPCGGPEQMMRVAQLVFVASSCAGLAVCIDREACGMVCMTFVRAGRPADVRYGTAALCRASEVFRAPKVAPSDDAADPRRPEHAWTGGASAPMVYDLTTSSHRFQAGVGSLVVHNTDSIFVVFDNKGATGRDALASSIRQGQATSAGIKPQLAPPHNLEYEKTMFPLLLLSKKRYVGLLYTDDPDDPKPKQKSMGIALKRRDYAQIVKVVYGGTIEIILRQRDVPQAVRFLKGKLQDLAEGRYELQDLVISKTLRSYYKLPHQIAHCVLARRMYDRDPGSAPQVNDRVPYVFVETSKKNALMGDRIEHVDYVRAALAAAAEGGGAARVRVDTKLYIQNQLMKPCTQLLAIALEQLPGYAPKPELSGARALDAQVVAKAGNRKKARERLDVLREREIERLVFDPVLALPVFRERDNRCNKQQAITSFFKAS